MDVSKHLVHEQINRTNNKNTVNLKVYKTYLHD
jgi:hypothetical protein